MSSALKGLAYLRSPGLEEPPIDEKTCGTCPDWEQGPNDSKYGYCRGQSRWKNIFRHATYTRC